MRAGRWNARREAVLFFGCRRNSEDFLYKDELLAALQSGALRAVQVVALLSRA